MSFNMCTCLWNHQNQDNEHFCHRQLFHFKVKQGACTQFKTVWWKQYLPLKNNGTAPCRANLFQSIFTGEVALHLISTRLFLFLLLSGSNILLRPMTFLVLQFAGPSPFQTLPLRSIPFLCWINRFLSTNSYSILNKYKQKIKYSFLPAHSSNQSLIALFPAFTLLPNFQKWLSKLPLSTSSLLVPQSHTPPSTTQILFLTQSPLISPLICPVNVHCSVPITLWHCCPLHPLRNSLVVFNRRNWWSFLKTVKQ